MFGHYNQSKSLPAFRVVTTLDSISGLLIQTSSGLGSLRLEETTEILRNSSYFGIIVYCSSYLVLRES